MKRTLFLIVFILIAQCLLAQSILFRETFPNRTINNGDTTLTTVGWSRRVTTDGVNVTISSSASIINNNVGVGDSVAIGCGNAYPYDVSTSNGFIYTTTSCIRAMFYTNKTLTFTQVGQKLTKIHFYMSSASQSFSFYVLVKQGSNYYAYDSLITVTTTGYTANTNFDKNNEEKTITIDPFTTTKWRPINTTAITLGAGGALPSADITGFGWLVDKNTTTANTTVFRFDTFEATFTPDSRLGLKHQLPLNFVE